MEIFFLDCLFLVEKCSVKDINELISKTIELYKLIWLVGSKESCFHNAVAAAMHIKYKFSSVLCQTNFVLSKPFSQTGYA